MEEQKHEERMIRLLSTDIEGKMQIYPALTKIKGISWAMANAICCVLGFLKNKKIGSLSEDELKKISDFVKNPKVPKFMLNREKDFNTGEDMHLIGSDLDLKKEFDIKRLKKIKCYRGFRHMLNLPLRGQRTRSNFRKNKAKGVGIKKKGKKK
jgi:small subunit ribosomal protein S13